MADSVSANYIENCDLLMLDYARHELESYSPRSEIRAIIQIIHTKNLCILDNKPVSLVNRIYSNNFLMNKIYSNHLQHRYINTNIDYSNKDIQEFIKFIERFRLLNRQMIHVPNIPKNLYANMIRFMSPVHPPQTTTREPGVPFCEASVPFSLVEEGRRYYLLYQFTRQRQGTDQTTILQESLESFFLHGRTTTVNGLNPEMKEVISDMDYFVWEENTAIWTKGRSKISSDIGQKGPLHTVILVHTAEGNVIVVDWSYRQFLAAELKNVRLYHGSFR
jgi:hypothetical protein